MNHMDENRPRRRRFRAVGHLRNLLALIGLAFLLIEAARYLIIPLLVMAGGGA